MPPRPFVNDGLWRCLCPGFPSNARLLPRATTAAGTATQYLRAKPCDQSRPYHVYDTPPAQEWDTQSSGTRPSKIRWSKTRSSNTPSSDSTHQWQLKPSAIIGHTANRKEARALNRTISLARQPTATLYELLSIEGAKGHYDAVLLIINVLIRDREERPNKDMYAAILHSFVSSENGTAGKVRKVLEEMGFWEKDGWSMNGVGKIDLDHKGCEVVLEALAVHPDYLLRNEILEHMKARWYTLSPRTHNFVVAGLLRDRLFEQALEKLDDMVRNDVKIEKWLLDKAMWMLLEFGQTEEAFHIFNLRHSLQSKDVNNRYLKPSSALLGAMLDAAGREQLVSAVLLPTPASANNASTNLQKSYGWRKFSPAISSHQRQPAWPSCPSPHATAISS
jgi:pentatricopeptide repeat protein